MHKSIFYFIQNGQLYPPKDQRYFKAIQIHNLIQQNQIKQNKSNLNFWITKLK